jgi:hypothetical protein
MRAAERARVIASGVWTAGSKYFRAEAGAWEKSRAALEAAHRLEESRREWGQRGERLAVAAELSARDKARVAANAADAAAAAAADNNQK